MTGKLIRMELRRAVKSRGMSAALLIGTAISLVHIFHNIIPYAKYWNEAALHLKGNLEYPVHLYREWICGNTYNLEGFLYFMIFPILVVLPQGGSFFEDKQNGFIRQMYIRANRMEYLLAKSVSAFLTGGAVMVLPLLLNLGICAALLPALYPQQLSGSLMTAAILWHRLYAAHPLLYVLLFLTIDFIFAGLVACLPLLFSFYTEKKYILLLMPFVIHLFLYSALMMIGSAKAVSYAPAYVIFAGHGCFSGLVLIGYLIVYFLLGGAAFWITGKNEDVF